MSTLCKGKFHHISCTCERPCGHIHIDANGGSEVKFECQNPKGHEGLHTGEHKQCNLIINGYYCVKLPGHLDQHKTIRMQIDEENEKRKMDDPVEKEKTMPKYMVVRKDVYGLRAYICERDYNGNWRTILEGEVEVVENLVKDLNK